MRMKGFIGEVVYQGDLTKFYPLLKIGEYIHVGKNTTFGLGKYEIVKI
jgi:CRISPR/Cas system endoribonuclease Cas6 (RAMP superfamily)